jgi:hypothetical protein
MFAILPVWHWGRGIGAIVQRELVGGRSQRVGAVWVETVVLVEREDVVVLVVTVAVAGEVAEVGLFRAPSLFV